MPTLPRRTQVLIVGAGPSGLAAALSLKKHGCTDIIVVEASNEGQNSSRAIAVFPATLEALDEVGCAASLVEASIKPTGGKIWDGYTFHDQFDFRTLTGYTKYPFMLLTPQHITERILEQRVREQTINVYRPCRVIDLQVNRENSDHTNVVFEDGQVVEADYVVGADGARSTVRQLAGITYLDPNHKKQRDQVKQGVMADIVLEGNPTSPVGHTKLLYILGDGNFFFMFPLPAGSYEEQYMWRIGCGVLSGEPPNAPSAEYLQNLLDTEGPAVIPSSVLPNYPPPKIAKVMWSTRFRTDSAIADKYLTRLTGSSPSGGQITGGYVLLIGDAAHKQPPTGGQGMNLGLRDAIFLGPVLTQHIVSSAGAQSKAEREQADEQLVKWARERHTRALTVVALANRTLSMFSIRRGLRWYFGVIPVNWAWVRSWIMWFFTATGISTRVAPWQLSGLNNR